MKPLGPKKNHEASWTKKITQPLGPNKSQATFWAQQKVMQPPNLKKKIAQPLGPKKIHATSWAKKKSCNLPGQKKKSHNLYCPNNHATSEPKKNYKTTFAKH